MKKKNKYRTYIKPEECKGCGRCVEACPKKVLKIGKEINSLGHTFACYAGKGCVGCGICFYSCPEPGAITVYEIEEDDKNESEKRND